MEHINISVNKPTVVSEVIEGEAVIMHLTSGRYFSCMGVGSAMWSLIEEGTTTNQISRHVLSRYAVQPDVLDRAFTTFLASLEEHDLVRLEPAQGEGPESETASQTPIQKSVFQEPVLNVYADMEDLLLLDPIHDVDETGWPEPKPAEEGAA